MRTRPIGSSGIQASVVGLGTWPIGGWMWGGSDDDASIRAIRAGLDAGITFVDTAPAYGFGVAEEVVGRAIAGRRDAVVLASKCGVIASGDRGRHFANTTARAIDADGHISMNICLAPDSIRHELEMSLKRLRTDRIDLYLTHRQERHSTPIEDTMAELLRLKDQGKIRAIGASNATMEEINRYRAAGELDADEEQYSMIDRGIEAEQLPSARAHGVAMIAYSSLAQGLLSGRITPERTFATGDQRNGNPRFTMENRKRIAELLGRFQPVADRHGCTITQLVIAWTVHQPGLTHALVGARTEQQAVENAAAGGIELSADDLAVMDTALAELGPAIT